MDLQDAARRYSVGVCSLVASGDREGAAEAMRQYVKDAMLDGHMPYEAMLLMTNSLIGLAVAAAENAPDGSGEYFRQTALGLAVKS